MRLLLIAFALVALNAQQPTSNPGVAVPPGPPQTLEKPAKRGWTTVTMTDAGPQATSPLEIYPSAFAMYNEAGKLTLSISREGKVTFGEGVTPDEAARQFAAAMERYGLRMCTPAKPEASAKDAAKE